MRYGTFVAMLNEALRAMVNRLRTALAMLGMVIGVGAVVIMLGVGRGAQLAVEQSIASMGSNLFIVLSGASTSGGLRFGSGTTPTLTLKDADALAQLPSVKAVAPTYSGSAQMVHGANNWSTVVVRGGRQTPPLSPRHARSARGSKNAPRIYQWPRTLTAS